MADKNTIVTNTRELLYGRARFERPVLDTVVGSETSGDTEIRLTTDSMWKRDDIAALHAEGSNELIYFTEDHPAAADSTVIRGFGGSTAEALSAGDVVERNPLFPRADIEKWVDDVVDNELWPHVWIRSEGKVASVTPAVDRAYDLGARELFVDRVYQYNLDGLSKIYDLPFGTWDVVDAAHSDIASTPVLIVRSVRDDNFPLYYTARQRPSSSDYAGLSSELAAIVPFMAASRAALARMSGENYDPSRQEREGDERGKARRAYQTLAAEFLRRRQEEHNRLLRELDPDRRFKRHQLGVRRLLGA